ncbi:SPFH domain-containing protein, partial [Yoonia sp.]|uniref:SPFH domain-containing protein n=1 Tax=Yoonia sp. TaxID=2212373 RepID=UPI003974F149
MDEISYQIRNIIVQEFSRVIAQSGIPVLDMAANTADLGKLVASAIDPTMKQYGLTIPELYIENISLPSAVEDALDKRTSMGLAGDLGKFTQYSAAEAMTSAAGNPAGGGMAAGLGAGMGMAMANQMAQGGPWGSTAAAPPPPPPVEHVWHIATGGDVTGPFSKAAMGRMVTEGTLSRNSMVWTQGQDGWKAAGDVIELAQLFTIMPPPPPGA